MSKADTALEDLAETVGAGSCFRIVGADGHAGWRVDPPGPPILSLGSYTGIIDAHPADQVVVVRAGTLLDNLQRELATFGQTLPYAPFEAGDNPSLGGALALALPHRLEGQYGTWRDWVLGMTVIRPDGATAKCGSMAVKNVAGYDVAKLMIGARGALGVIANIILRTFPLKALREPACEPSDTVGKPLWVQRVKFGEKSCLPQTERIDSSTATLWTALPQDERLPRRPGDWVMRRGCGADNLPAPQHRELLERTKSLFDPNAKLNPGALGE